MTDLQKLIETGEADLAPLGSNIEEALAAAKTPMAALAAAYNHAPSELVRRCINVKAQEVLLIDLPALQDTVLKGPAMVRDEVDSASLTEMFTSSMDRIAEKSPEDAPSATVRQAGEEIAELIDSTVKRVLLEDDFANREAYQQIIQAHARLTAALDSLALTEDQQKMAEEMLDAQKEAAGGAQ
jgi:hypothetical protein